MAKATITSIHLTEQHETCEPSPVQPSMHGAGVGITDRKQLKVLNLQDAVVPFLTLLHSSCTLATCFSKGFHPFEKEVLLMVRAPRGVWTP